MKIAIIGTHGTGKTTLAYGLTAHLKKQGVNASMLTEVARKCPLPINQKCSMSSQVWILSTQLKEEIELEKDFEVVVCDRSIIDTYIYTLYVVGEEEARKIEPLVREFFASYDILFKMPIMDGYMVEDGVRDVDNKFQTEVDALMSSYLEKNYVPHYELPIKNQFEFINDVLKDKLFNQKLLKEYEN